ncbi:MULTISPECIES: 30S ribosomal protein S14 [Enterococcus]|uniref:30S ribosomal protein S14 n=1 Tax=Enterococcus TaxID=1350 RepID=UPI0022E7217E|nr:30S ribosomal protein S14 [Enterococcus casseliflavus]MEB6086565.1 30S ribosomal protein S14 [Enterococcus casseliflavus]MEB6146316.1 30S ribosomal protein S14 [Enterococcus casseliflavus]
MAKKSKIAKYNKQVQLIEQYRAVRQELKAQGDTQALAKLPKDSIPTRLKKRDMIDGRPRGYMNKFGMSRINFRKHAHLGEIPGVTKASW